MFSRWGLRQWRRGVRAFQPDRCYNASMLMEVLKGLEMLIAVLKGRGTADHRREVLAKEVLAIHQEVNGVVTRGRRILELAADDSNVNNPESITLLSEQLGALQRVKEDLTTGTVGSVLDLHLPDVTKNMGGLLDWKYARVWIRLNQIVSGSKELSDAEWIQEMEDQMGMRELPEGDGHVYKDSPPWPYALKIYAPGWQKLQKLPRTEVVELLKDYRLSVVATDLDYVQAHQILDQIDAANEELRKFLTEKFKLEDVL